MSFFHQNPLKVKLVDADLVASFQRANPPLVWKLDLDRNHSFTIALQGEEGDWELGITSPKGEFYPIAHFPVREDAEDALMAVQKILMKKRRSRWMGLLRFVIGLLIVIGLIAGGLYYAGSRMGLTDITAGLPDLATPITPKKAEIPSGVPLSADDVLKAPQ